MRFGVQLPYGNPGVATNLMDTILAVARAADTTGFDSVWLPDHFQFASETHPGEGVPMSECLTTLAAVAVVTERVKIGPYVAGVPCRNPALLAKTCATLDNLSHGRLVVGLGAAWHRDEFAAYGYPFPPVRQRMDGLEDAVQIVDRMLRESTVSYTGSVYSVAGAMNSPQPVQRPRPPILIGGEGERRTLRIVARHADWYNTFQGGPDVAAHKFAVLREQCAAVGRPYGDILRTKHVTVLLARDDAELARKREQYGWFLTHPPVIGTPETVIARLREYVDAGAQYLILDMPDADALEPLSLFMETVAPAFADVP